MTSERNDALNFRRDVKAAAKVLHKYPAILPKHLKHAMRDVGERWRSRLRRDMTYPRPEPGEPNSNKGLSTRAGRLRASLRVEVQGEDLSTLRMTMASRGVPYAAAQELGATIKPRTKRWLTEPRKAALTPAGVLRKSAAAYFREDKKNTFVVELSGGLYIVRRKPGKTKKAKDQFDFLFRLRKQTTIPGPDSTGAKSRFGFFDAWDIEQVARVQRLEAAIDSALKEASKRA